jgi:hypothetical protein
MPGKTSSAGKGLTASSPDRRSLSVSVIRMDSLILPEAQPRGRLRALIEREHLFCRTPSWVRGTVSLLFFFPIVPMIR